MANLMSLLLPPKTPIDDFDGTLKRVTESDHILSLIYYAWTDEGVSPYWHDYCKGKLWNLDQDFYRAVEDFCDSFERDDVTDNPVGKLINAYYDFTRWEIKRQWLLSAFPILTMAIHTTTRRVEAMEDFYDVDLTEPCPKIAMKSFRIMK